MGIRIAPILILVFGINLLGAGKAVSKLGNTIEQNRSQYGKEKDIEQFSQSETSFTGYRTYNLNSKWLMTAFFKNGTVRSEHMHPKSEKEIMSREEVRDWAVKMFPQGQRGAYMKRLNRVRAEGHFFNNGLVAYELFIVGKATKGFNGIKVLLYENDKKYYQINAKSYI